MAPAMTRLWRDNVSVRFPPASTWPKSCFFGLEALVHPFFADAGLIFGEKTGFQRAERPTCKTNGY